MTFVTLLGGGGEVSRDGQNVTADPVTLGGGGRGRKVIVTGLRVSIKEGGEKQGKKAGGGEG